MLKELSAISGTPSSCLGHIEWGERFPSASILRRIARPLGSSEGELFARVGYLFPQPPIAVESEAGRLDPYVAAVLSQEPVEIQRAVIGILSILKSMARGDVIGERESL